MRAERGDLPNGPPTNLVVQIQGYPLSRRFESLGEVPRTLKALCLNINQQRPALVARVGTLARNVRVTGGC